MKDNELTMISVDRISPHPNNPRKDLGDLSELTESIRKQGIMQNLTVIRSGDGYTALIGHRRLAAARAAGLTEVPCKVIEGLSEADQLGIMLEENMQRNDLTIIEQAQSFQLMMDLGETEDSIAERTGFSKTTVRRRLNVAKLDQEILGRKVNDDSFQISFSDLFALEKIKDIEKRNALLNTSRDSAELRWKIQAELNDEIRKENREKLRTLVENAGIKVLKSGTGAYYSERYNTIQTIDLKDSEFPSLKNGKKGQKVFVEFTNTAAYILTRKEKEKKEELLSKEQIKKQEATKKGQALKALYKEALVGMRDFILTLIDGKNKLPDIIPELWKLIIDVSAWTSFNGLQEFILNKYFYEASEDERKTAKEKAQSLSVEIQMMILVYMMFRYKSPVKFGATEVYYDQETMNSVKDFVEILAGLGFSFPNEEYLQMLYGTHKFYDNEKEDA